jgi:hypothetical protein
MSETIITLDLPESITPADFNEILAALRKEKYPRVFFEEESPVKPVEKTLGAMELIPQIKFTVDSPEVQVVITLISAVTIIIKKYMDSKMIDVSLDKKGALKAKGRPEELLKFFKEYRKFTDRSDD